MLIKMYELTKSSATMYDNALYLNPYPANTENDWSLPQV